MSNTGQPVLLEGGIAVITGAASGIGEALARHAASELHMRVVLADIDREGLERVAAGLAADGCDVLAVPTDVSDPAALDALATQTLNHFGAPRLLVNNAGIETVGWSWEIPTERWEQILNVNIHGVVHGVRAFLPAKLEAGEPCVIANLSSIAGISTAPFQASYIMSKHAVLAYSECLQLELRMKGAPIQVSAVLPGPVQTPIFSVLNRTSDPQVAQHLADMEDLLEHHGLATKEAAEVIFAQIAAGEFWVSTHPDMTRAMAALRGQQLSELRAPDLDSNSGFDIGDS